MQGQSVFVSSGDDGSAALNSSCLPTTSSGVNEMAASQNVTAVGGTQFTANFDTSGNNVGNVAEQVWNNSSGATGGGRSAIFGKPNFQQGKTPVDGARDLPDVALGASANTPGFYIFLNGRRLVYGGTASLARCGLGFLGLSLKRLVRQVTPERQMLG